jgi:hypothetical protein
MSDQKEDQQQEAGKELKKFEKFKRQLVALVGGETPLRKRAKASKDVVQQAMEILLSEKKAAKIKEVKDGAEALCEKYIAFMEFKSQKEKEFAKAVEEKMKEFNKEAETLFGKLEGIDQMEKTYLEALQGATTGGVKTGTSALGETEEQ